MYTVYILECADGTFYTGITNNLPRRLAAHKAGTAARYTRARGFAGLRYSESQPNRSAAQVREAAIKKLSRAEKEHLITTV
jgi:predicted GIY-YIG superfamily endonuclease